jgi:hypothetical protein
MLEYKRWDYFLDGGTETIGLQRAPEATIAMTCAREWLDPLLTDAEKAEIERQIAEKGAPACFRTLYGMKYPERVKGWGFDPEDDYAFRFDLRRWPLILNSTNLKVIPIAGLGMAACLLYGKHPLAERWLNLAVGSARAFAVMYGADGAYDEGVGYWGYTSLHLVLLAEVVRRKLGMNLKEVINFPGTVRYGLQMSMPTIGRPADCVNFGDAWNMGDVSVAAWTAREFDDPVAQYVAGHVGSINNHFAAIWFDPERPATVPGKELLDVRLSNDVVVSHTGWDDRASVAALRSGGPANHEHADRNAVIFAAFGERLYHDPYHAAYSHTEPHWKLRLTESHTALLINGKGHQYHDGSEGTNASWADAKVLRYAADGKSLVVSSEATDAYQLVIPSVKRVLRTLVFLKPDILVLVDRVSLGESLPVQARFQIDDSDGKGSGEILRDGFLVRRPSALLRCVCRSSGGITLRLGQIDLPVEHGIHPFVEVASAPASEHTIVSAAIAAPGSAPVRPLSVDLQGERVTIVDDDGPTKRTIAIDLRGDVPTALITGDQ